jgi:Nucleoside 2-deoxyribosyltransferase
MKFRSEAELPPAPMPGVLFTEEETMKPIFKPTIYFAGKIKKGNWRAKILGDRGSWNDAYNNMDCLLDPKVDLREDRGSFWYGGPFFISCDHGCAHGRGLHAASGSCGGYGNLLETRSKIWAANRRLIERADNVFAYIDETDCFGTLIELGYAAALEKPLWVAFGRNVSIEKFDDMWMARECGGEGYPTYPWYGHVGEPREAFADFLNGIGAVKGLQLASPAMIS